MQNSMKIVWMAVLMTVLLAGTGFGQSLPPDVKAKVDAKIKQLQSWSTDPAVISAVKAHNTSPSADAVGMTNEKWAGLSVLDPVVRGYTRNPLALWLKSKRDDQIAECFVSGADGKKVAFLSKTTYWNHSEMDKHKVPMSGRIYIGPVALDQSTGQQLVQVGLPVLDGGKPVGSIVVGLTVSKL